MRTRKWRRRALAVLLAPVLTTTFLSLVPAPASAAGVANGGFETGDFTSWTLRRTGPAPVIDTAVVKTGTYSAYLGSTVPGGDADSQITQTVAVPANGTTKVDFDWYPYSYEYEQSGGTVGCMQYDWQDFLVFDETGTTIGAGLGLNAGLLMHTCSDAQTWQHEQFDLTPWAGSTIAIGFGVKQDGVYNTSMRVDNVVVTTVVPPLVTNGDFETCDLSGWTVHGDSPTPTIDSTVTHSGGCALLLGTPGGWGTPEPNGNSEVYQDVSVPASGPTTLDFWYYPQTTDSVSYDWQEVKVYDTDNNLLEVLMHQASNDQTWVQASYDLSEYAGQTIRLMFNVRQDGWGDPTSMRVDDIALTNVPDVATSTALASNHNPSVFGQAVELTATVSPASGSGVPTGTVEFWEGTTKLGEDAVNSSGHATLTVSDFAVSSHSVIAKYLPAAHNGFTGSESDPFEQAVHKADTTTTINSVTPAHPTYGQKVSFTRTVAPVAPGDGTPSGAVTYKVNKFAGTPDATGYVDFDPATDVLPAGTHHVEAYYAGDGNFNGSQSNAFVVTVDKATSTVTYLGDYLAIAGNPFTFKANVDSPVTECKGSRVVRFKLMDGDTEFQSFTATSGAGGAVTKTVDTTGWTTGEYGVVVEVVAGDNCTAADNRAAMDVMTVASPGDAATGGGWYFYKDSGAGKRVNFGFTVAKQADNSYKGSLLLMNQGVWRLKGNLDSYTSTAPNGQAGGTGTLYQWVLANQSDPTSGYWANPRAVSFKIAFADQAAGKAGGKKTVVVDQFALSQISVRSSNPPLPVSALMPLKGGNIVLR